MSGPLRLRHRVLDAIRRHGLWRPGERVFVACSGGRDSTVLLDVLAVTQRAHGAMLHVLCVDHGQRPSSVEDVVFVERLAAERGLPFEARRVMCGSSEDAMRQARHAVFRSMGATVALGHHQRDQAETLLLQVLRGTSAMGRRGMLSRRDPLVRPLLEESPRALAAWVDQRGLGFRVDPTNALPNALRNRIRHEVLPLLEALRPGAEATLARSARHARDDEALLGRLAARVPLTGDGLAQEEPALARRALLQRFPALSAAHVDGLLAVASQGGGRVPIGGGRVLVVDHQGVWVEGVGEQGSGVI